MLTRTIVRGGAELETYLVVDLVRDEGERRLGAADRVALDAVRQRCAVANVQPLRQVPTVIRVLLAEHGADLRQGSPTHGRAHVQC